MTTVPQSKQGNRSPILWIVGALAAVVVLGGGALFALTQLGGDGDVVAAGMPSETAVYVGVNVLAANPARMQEFAAAFDDAFAQMGEQESDQSFEDLIAELEIELGFSAEEVQAWVGQYLGFGLLSFDIESETAEWITAVSVRDEAAADQFLAARLAEVEAGVVNSIDYEGVTISTVNSIDFDQPVAVARSADLMYLGSSAAAVQQAIDAQGSDANLTQNENYQTILADLPERRAVAIYVNPLSFEGVYQELTADLPVNTGQVGIEAISGVGVALSVIEAGIQIDGVTRYNPDFLDETQAQLLASQGIPASVSEQFPSGTVMLLGGQRLDLVWANLREGLVASLGQQDFDESLSLFTQQFGFDPNTELFPLLNGGWALGMVPAQGGVIAAEAGVPLGYYAIFESSDTVRLAELLGNVSVNLTQQGLPLAETQQSDAILYEFTEFETPLVAAGTNDTGLLIGSSSNDIGAWLESGDSLADDTRFTETWAAFPSGEQPLMFFDVTAVLDSLAPLAAEDPSLDEEFIRPLRPLSRVAVAIEANEGNTVRQTVIFFIDTE